MVGGTACRFSSRVRLWGLLLPGVAKTLDASDEGERVPQLAERLTMTTTSMLGLSGDFIWAQVGRKMPVPFFTMCRGNGQTVAGVLASSACCCTERVSLDSCDLTFERLSGNFWRDVKRERLVGGNARSGQKSGVSGLIEDGLAGLYAMMTGDQNERYDVDGHCVRRPSCAGRFELRVPPDHNRSVQHSSICFGAIGDR